MAARMLDFLGPSARSVRRSAHLRQIDIATAAGVSHTIVSRFELGEAWPVELDAIIAAYAHETGLRAIDIWDRALAHWRASEDACAGS